MMRISTSVAGLAAVVCLVSGAAVGRGVACRPVAIPEKPAALASAPVSVAAEIPAPSAPPVRTRSLAESLRPIRPILLEKDYEGLREHWEDLVDAAKKDPAGYGALLRAPENEAIFDDLLDVFGYRPSGSGVHGPLKDALPPEVQDAFIDLARRGTVAQKRAIARWVRDQLRSSPDQEMPMIEPCLALLSSEDPRSRAAALDVVRFRRLAEIDRYVGSAHELWGRSDDPEVRQACLALFTFGKSSAAEQLFLEKMAETLQREAPKPTSGFLIDCLSLLGQKMLFSPAEQTDRYAGLLLSAMRAASEPETFRTCARAAFDLPAPQAAQLLDQALASAPTPETRISLRLALNEMAAGEVRPDRLRDLVYRCNCDDPECPRPHR